MHGFLSSFDASLFLGTELEYVCFYQSNVVLCFSGYEGKWIQTGGGWVLRSGNEVIEHNTGFPTQNSKLIGVIGKRLIKVDITGEADSILLHFESGMSIEIIDTSNEDRTSCLRWTAEDNHAIMDTNVEPMKTSDKEKKRGTKWMKFWIYVFLPALTLFFVFAQTTLLIKFNAPYKAFIYTAAVTVLLSCVIYGLHKRYPFAWWTNILGVVFFLLGVCYKGFSNNPPTETREQITIIGMFLIFITLHLIYWCKRRHLFCCADSPRRQKAILSIFAFSLFYIIFAFT